MTDLMKEAPLKIFKWLELYDLAPDQPYDNDGLSAQFLAETGVSPCWPIHTASEAAEWPDIQIFQPLDPDKFICLADEVAVALAENFAPAQWSQYAGEEQSRYVRLRRAILVLRCAYV